MVQENIAVQAYDPLALGFLIGRREIRDEYRWYRLARPEEREIIRRSLGLDRPLHEQYLAYIANFLRGDKGISILYKTPVRDIVVDRLLNTGGAPSG